LILSYKHQPLITGEQSRYEKRKKETRLDIRTGSRTKIAREKESAREENCKDPQANRGRDTTKSVQLGTFARLSRLASRSSLSATLPTSPATHVRGVSLFSWHLPPAPSAPAAPKTAATPNKPHHKQKYDGADGGVDDRRNNAGTEMDANSRQQPVANECADNTDDEIADEPISGSSYDLSGQPAGNKTDD
jgi:hypothetical protein